MHQKHIQLLMLLLEATRGRRAVWQNESSGVHRTELAGIPCSLRFKPARLAGTADSDGEVVEVTLAATILTFWPGSDGHDLVEDILAAAYPEILEQTRTVSRRLDAMIDRIQTAAA